MRRVSGLLMILIVGTVMLQAQRMSNGSHGATGVGVGRPASAASNSIAHPSSGHGQSTVTIGGPIPGRMDGHRFRRPFRRGFGNVWLPWSYPYWGDDFYADDSYYLEPANTPPQVTAPVVEYREPARPAAPPESPKVTEVTLSKEVAPAKPLPPTVFVLSDGEKVESRDYLLTASSLRIEVGRARRITSVNQLNIDATLAANHERGIELTFPRNSGTVVLGF
jgi:hypothetical protein